MLHGLALYTTFKLFTPRPVYFDAFLSIHLITAFTTMLLVARWHMASLSSIIYCPWWHEKWKDYQYFMWPAHAGQRWIVWLQTLTTWLLTMRVIWDVMFCHPVCRFWHLQGTTLLQNLRQYPPSLTAPHPRGTASFNMNWSYATCDAYVV